MYKSKMVFWCFTLISLAVPGLLIAANPCGNNPSTPTTASSNFGGTTCSSGSWSGANYTCNCSGGGSETINMNNQLQCKIWVNSACNTSYAAKDMTGTVTNFGAPGNLNGNWSWSNSSVAVNNGTTVIFLYTISGLPTSPTEWYLAASPIVKTNSCGQVCGVQPENCTGIGAVLCASANNITSAMTITKVDKTRLTILDDDPSSQVTNKTYYYAVKVTDGTNTRYSDPSILNKGSGD